MMLSTVSGNPWALTTAGTTRANSGTSRRMATLRRLWAGLMCGALGACTSRGEAPLRLGTTYTVEQSGALAHARSEEHTSELQSQSNLVCRLLLEKKKQKNKLVPS